MFKDSHGNYTGPVQCGGLNLYYQKNTSSVDTSPSKQLVNSHSSRQRNIKDDQQNMMSCQPPVKQWIQRLIIDSVCGVKKGKDLLVEDTG